MTTGGLSPLLLSSVDIAIISLKEKLSSQVQTVEAQGMANIMKKKG